jgi:REP element-mobilizing transposase RayT
MSDRSRPLYGSRRASRLHGYDYTCAGAYFVTICVQHRLPLFGTLDGAHLVPSQVGAMVERLWCSLAEDHHGVIPDYFIAMPNHTHGILLLDGNDAPALSAVVGAYKSRTTVEYTRGVKGEGWPRFDGTVWQRGFYDHVIRDDDELHRIRAYIETNPMRTFLRQQGKWSTERVGFGGDG